LIASRSQREAINRQEKPPMKTHRLARVAEVVREVASQTILFELRDPRVQGVTVTRAEVSADLQHAKVYVSLMGTPKEQQLCLHGLKHAAGFLQAKVASRLQTRFTPVIRFVVDEGVKKSIEMTRLINEALAQSAPPAGASPDAPAAAEPADGTAAEARDEGDGKQ
jgi:ribosome-binding factor A